MELSKYIDHTNLKNTATLEDIQKLCQEAIDYHFMAVCVAPYYVAVACELLKGTSIEIDTVIGFPFGYATTASKVYEAIDAVENGATEIDMVININALKNKDYEYVKNEIEEVRDAIDGKTLKVIIETCYLTEDEKLKMVEICNETFVNYIKTSTGFGSGGATIEDIHLLHSKRNEVLEIKASGGIRDYKTAVAFVDAGATRIGTSYGVSIMEEEVHETI